ncbi:hypothetical protein KY285_027489 [Solanum tuberosum]|nr:hypothetical protein KY289_027687 [Solanum tuberosum]KAH0666271.1 hypothetical protein KY285_027477 [Solanum tuberosum]KAH0666283.1 hypothetical protein KY285_027489 [Solanum tuberosum]
MHARLKLTGRLKRLLRYLKNTANYGLRIAPSTTLNLSVFSDADWAVNLTDRKYWAVASTVHETTWVKNLLKELHVQNPTPPTIFRDNLGVTY